MLAGGPAWAASKKKSERPAGSRLVGQVRAADGKTPAKGVIVEVRPLNGGTSLRSAPSDRKGRFAIEGIPYGWAEVLVVTDAGGFLGDQALNLPPGKKVEITLALLTLADRPESWWTERHLEPPADLPADRVAGLAQSSQKLTGVEYWKSPTGLAILIGASVAALAVIAAGGRSYDSP
jgi:hypothetical protein